jgi:hypothetical protein
MTQYGYHTKLEEILRLMAENKIPKSFLNIFHNGKVVKSQICRVQKKLPKDHTWELLSILSQIDTSTLKKNVI